MNAGDKPAHDAQYTCIRKMDNVVPSIVRVSKVIENGAEADLPYEYC